MKRFGSNLFGQAIKAAGIGAALMLSVSASHAQSGPFAGFDGSWSGNGTVSLSDGTVPAGDGTSYLFTTIGQADSAKPSDRTAKVETILRQAVYEVMKQ